MVREIVHDPIFLAQKSEPAAEQDMSVGEDLLDTLEANREKCVGMAANMIGVRKRIIVFDNCGTAMLMYNPELLKVEGPFSTEEGCLSLTGVRPVKRYKKIKVTYLDDRFRVRTKVFEGWTAQIIQHEIDHLNGIVI